MSFIHSFIWQMFHSPISCGRHFNFKEFDDTQPILQEPSSPPTGVNPGDQIGNRRHHHPSSPPSMQLSWISLLLFPENLELVCSGDNYFWAGTGTHAMEQLPFSVYVKKQRKLAGRKNRLKLEGRGKQRWKTTTPDKEPEIMAALVSVCWVAQLHSCFWVCEITLLNPYNKHFFLKTITDRFLFLATKQVLTKTVSTAMWLWGLN